MPHTKKTETNPITDFVPRRDHENYSSPPAALKVKDARAYLGGLSKPTIYRLVERGLLRPNRATRHLLFTVAELDRFLETGAK